MNTCAACAAGDHDNHGVQQCDCACHGRMTVELLSRFCGGWSTAMHAPFSSGAYTYATNGHIALRVRRIESVPEVAGSPNVEKILVASGNPMLVPLVLDLPENKVEQQECSTCEGRKTEHDCPSCNCDCEDCAGTGIETNESDEYTSIGIRGVPFAAKYMRLLILLPGVLFDPKPKAACATRFDFDGGEGMLMPLREARINHIEVSL